MKPKRFYVYVLARPDGTVFYVGKGLGRRIRVHEEDARRGHQCPKCRAIREIWSQGGQVQHSIIFSSEDEAEAFAYERQVIAMHEREILVNITDGGKGKSGRVWTKEQRAKVIASTKARFSQPAARTKLSLRAKARWADPDFRSRTERALRDRMATPETRRKVSAALRRYYADPETRAKVSAASKAAWSAPETGARIQAATKAGMSTPVAWANRSAAAKLAWARRKQREQTPDEGL